MGGGQGGEWIKKRGSGRGGGRERGEEEKGAKAYIINSAKTKVYARKQGGGIKQQGLKKYILKIE